MKSLKKTAIIIAESVLSGLIIFLTRNKDAPKETEVLLSFILAFTVLYCLWELASNLIKGVNK